MYEGALNKIKNLVDDGKLKLSKNNIGKQYRFYISNLERILVYFDLNKFLDQINTKDKPMMTEAEVRNEKRRKRKFEGKRMRETLRTFEDEETDNSKSLCSKAINKDDTESQYIAKLHKFLELATKNEWRNIEQYHTSSGDIELEDGNDCNMGTNSTLSTRYKIKIEEEKALPCKTPTK